jgi:DNA-binding NarL/FixJ family response regulator/anti-sigma regulatory factor (Ser/Thr protein kinase)
MNDPVRVMVVDDSASTRTMLKEALALGGGIEVVGEAGGGKEALSLTGELKPDVVLMDVRMPDLDGVTAARAIISEHPSTKIVALTWSDDPSTVRDMLSAGAIGYVVKGGTIDELSTAIRRAATGEAELDQRVLPAAVEDLRRLLEEERERREQVERLARAKAEFVQVLSHELRTPLTVISGAMRMLRDSDLKPDESQLLESGLRRVDQLEFLVEGLELIASAPGTEGMAHVEQAVASAAQRIGATPDRVEVSEELWRGVPHRYLERVAFELISNAVRHGQRPIEVLGHRQNRDAILEVIDEGGWAPPGEDFSAFSQEDMSATRSQGGFGLGLFVASRLAQACGGDLAIRAEDGKTIAQARFRLR